MEKETNTVKELNNILERLNEPSIVKSGDEELIFYPRELAHIDLDKIREQKEENPRGFRSWREMSSLESFIEYTNKFKDEASAVFFNDKRAVFNTVFDFDIGGEQKKPRWQKHGVRYIATYAPEIIEWDAHNMKWFDQVEFAAFIEKHCLDFIEVNKDDLPEEIQRLQMLLSGKFATPAGMLELSRGISVNRGCKAKSNYNRNTGARTISYEEKDSDIDVPNLFMIAIPLFTNSNAYRLPAQLRFKINDGEPLWQYEIHRYKESRDHAIREMVQKVKEETDLPVFYEA